jgi:hypothetical protein
MKKRMLKDEFIQWYVDGRHEFGQSDYELKVYRVISEANVHTALYGCDIYIHLPTKHKNFRWSCASLACPRDDYHYYRGIIPPSRETVNSAVERAGWLTSMQS